MLTRLQPPFRAVLAVSAVALAAVVALAVMRRGPAPPRAELRPSERTETHRVRRMSDSTCSPGGTMTVALSDIIYATTVTMSGPCDAVRAFATLERDTVYRLSRSPAGNAWLESERDGAVIEVGADVAVKVTPSVIRSRASR